MRWAQTWHLVVWSLDWLGGTGVSPFTELSRRSGSTPATIQSIKGVDVCCVLYGTWDIGGVPCFFARVTQKCWDILLTFPTRATEWIYDEPSRALQFFQAHDLASRWATGRGHFIRLSAHKIHASILAGCAGGGLSALARAAG